MHARHDVSAGNLSSIQRAHSNSLACCNVFTSNNKNKFNVEIHQQSFIGFRRMKGSQLASVRKVFRMNLSTPPHGTTSFRYLGGHLQTNKASQTLENSFETWQNKRLAQGIATKPFSELRSDRTNNWFSHLELFLTVARTSNRLAFAPCCHDNDGTAN